MKFTATVIAMLPLAVATHTLASGADGPARLLENANLDTIATVDISVPVPLRDGVRLAATVIVPRGRDRTELPVILIRSPYDPSAELAGPLASRLLPELLRAGYAVVVVNDRGTQWSEGSYRWLKGANQDGYDVLEWITRQRWSNGAIGTFGCSSSGESQLPLAS